MRLEIAIVVMVMINIMIFLGQTAITNVAADEGVTGPVFYDYEDSILKKYDAGGYTLSNNVSSLLPAGQGEVVPNTGNFFTDMFSTVKNWFLDIPGVNYAVGVVTAVPSLISNMGFPDELAFALGALWHVMTLILVVAWLFNR